MTKVDLIDQVSQKTELPKRDVERMLEAAIAAMQQALTHGEKVSLTGLGVFAALQVNLVSFAAPVATLSMMEQRGTSDRHLAATLAMVFAMVPALRAVLTAYDGWYAPIYMAEENADPGRSLPRAIIRGTLLVVALYLLVNVGFLRLLPLQVLAASDLPAAEAARTNPRRPSPWPAHRVAPSGEVAMVLSLRRGAAARGIQHEVSGVGR